MSTQASQSLTRLLNAEGIVCTLVKGDDQVDPEITLSKDLHIQVAGYNPDGMYSLCKCHFDKKGELEGVEYVYSTSSQMDMLKYIKGIIKQKAIA